MLSWLYTAQVCLNSTSHCKQMQTENESGENSYASCGVTLVRALQGKERYLRATFSSPGVLVPLTHAWVSADDSQH